MFFIHQTKIKNLEPDFILIDTHKGVCIIEVKDWDIDYIQSINRIEVTSTNGKKHPNPIYKTNKYYNFAKNLFEFDNNLINEEGYLKFNLYSKVAFVNIKSSELHDVVEDTKINISEIEAKFGKEVATLVEGASEPEDLVNVDDKSENWLERKSHTIETIKNANCEMKLLSCADKLANIRDIINDERQGKSVWSIFNASMECVAWYYKSMVKTFASGDENIIDMQAFNEFKKCVNEIFGDPNVIQECS